MIINVEAVQAIAPSVIERECHECDGRGSYWAEWSDAAAADPGIASLLIGDPPSEGGIALLTCHICLGKGSLPVRDVREVVSRLNDDLRAAGFPVTAEWQALCLAEEAGEAVGAVRRHLGLARRGGPLEAVGMELADVVITAYALAETLGLDMAEFIDKKIDIVYARGFREEGEGKS